jgi:membrane protease YdiL (CAAX protease family)
LPTPSSAPSPRPERPLRECLVAFAIATLSAAGFVQLARLIPFVAANLQAFVAAAFIYLVVWAARRRDADLAAFGFRLHPYGRNIAFGVLGPLLVFPAFWVGYAMYFRAVCASPSLGWLVPPGWCGRFVGWAGLGSVRLPAGLALGALNQLVVVAVPEELFFRGYLLELLERAWPPRRRVLGGGVGRALVASAALFGLGHFFVDGDPLRLATFFPGLLFGWMRSATGSIAPGAFVHAASNLYIQVLARTFFAY